ncbi:MAG: muconolactone Delta-isomerase family protein [Gammaproteobacteria bacterium]|jgi:muconolactone delta-isomerase
MEMLFMADIVKPDGMSDAEFYRIWRAESEAASAALAEGGIKHLWKAAGRYQVIGVFEFPDGDAMDAALHSLPIWKQGHHEMAQNIQWIPLRNYLNWAADLKELSPD